MAFLEVRDLSVNYISAGAPVRAVDRVSFSLERGQSLGIVGESGCGKSTLAFAISRLLKPNALSSGKVLLGGQDIMQIGHDDLSKLRWTRLSMVFQAAMNALNPVMTVRRQIIEPMLFHRTEPDLASANRRAEELFELVGLPSDRLDVYPHQLSGGMRQRAVLAMSLACRPDVLIADEPTTALDVVVQDQIFQRLNMIREASGLTLILISHDMGLIAENCDQIVVMYGGRAVETGPARQVLSAPRHPYSTVLAKATPSLIGEEPLISLPGGAPDLSQPVSGCIFEHRCPVRHSVCREIDPGFDTFAEGNFARCHFAKTLVPQDVISHMPAFSRPPAVARGKAIVEVSGLTKSFPLKRSIRQILRRESPEVLAVNRISFDVCEGEVIGIVGESGSGKTTLGMLLAALDRPTGGQVMVAGVDVSTMNSDQEKTFRRTVQVIFQDPYDSLNPRMRVSEILAEPLYIHGIGGDPGKRQERVIAMLTRVGLTPAERFAERFPSELSGGQRQRIAIARAMIVNPRVVIADEPLSMLDASVKAGIMALLADFKRDGVTIFVVTHDLSITRYLCDRIAVMYLGDLVEVGPAAAVVAKPWHPYTELLIASVPDPDMPRNRKLLVDGEPPSAARRPSGCPFHPRCSYVTEECRRDPPADLVANDRRSACWHAEHLRDSFPA